MPRPIDEMTPESLDREIANHERLGRTDLPRYAELLKARGERGGFDMKRSLDLIFEAARERRFLCYKDVTDAHGLEWDRARHAVNAHLGDLVTWSHRQGLPMVSAIIVSKPNQAEGRMDPDTLKGFIAAAEALGAYDGSEPAKFLKAQQLALFDLAASRTT